MNTKRKKTPVKSGKKKIGEPIAEGLPGGAKLADQSPVVESATGLYVGYGPNGTIFIEVNGRVGLLSPDMAIKFAAKLSSFGLGDARRDEVFGWDMPAPNPPVPKQ